MKLKRTLALIMGAALSVTSLAGCSQTTLNYADELAKTQKWEAISSEVNGKVSIDTALAKGDISFTSTGYSEGNKGYAKVDFKADDAINFKIPSIEVYVDSDTAYINKSYYEGIYTLNGQEVPQGLKDIKADYIAMDSGADAEQLKALTGGSESLINLGKLVFGDSDIDLPYTQNGREYTINLNSDEAVDLGVKGIKAAASNLENINKTFNLGLTSEDMSEIKNAVADSSFDATIANIKESVAGSTITSKESFTDDKYTADFAINLSVKELGNVSVTANGSSAKSEVKEVAIPSNSVKLTQEQLMNILTPAENQQTAQNTAA